jgi:hypothetical protein
MDAKSASSDMDDISAVAAAPSLSVIVPLAPDETA